MDHATDDLYDRPQTVTGLPLLNRLFSATSNTRPSSSSPASTGSPTAQVADRNCDQTLLDMLKDSYNEFRNSLDKNKQPSSIRKAIKDYRCHQAMIATLNAADPALNAHYCDGVKELDRLLRKITAEPQASTHRVLLKAGTHNVAIEIRNDASGSIAVLCLDSIGSNTAQSDALYKELKRTIEKHRGAHGVMISLDVQRTRLDCAIHAIYVLLQLKQHQGKITLIPPADVNSYNFSRAANEHIPLPIDFFGLMDSANAWNGLLEKNPTLANALLSDSNMTLSERIEQNKKNVTLSPSMLERFLAVRNCDSGDCGSVSWQHTYANSAELFRAELYRHTINWVENTPKSKVTNDINKIRPVKSGYEMLKRFPLTRAREPITPYLRYRLNPDVSVRQAQLSHHSNVQLSPSASSALHEVEQQGLGRQESSPDNVPESEPVEETISLKKKSDTPGDPDTGSPHDIEAACHSAAETEPDSIASLYTSYIKGGLVD